MANIELPKDAEGREIPLDTAELHTIWGCVFCIEKVKYARGMGWCFYGHLEGRTSHFAAIPSSLYLTPPDSWERLLDDLDKAASKTYCGACAYFGKVGVCACSSCIANKNESCERAVYADIASRIRKLRGES